MLLSAAAEGKVLGKQATTLLDHHQRVAQMIKHFV